MARPLPLQLGFAPLGAIALLALCTGCHSEPTVVDPVSGRTGLPRDSLTAFRAAAGWPPPPAPPAAAFRFANTLGDSMVMQQAPAGAVIWGFAPPGAAVAVYSTHPEVRRQQQEGPARAVAAANGSWLVHLPPAAGSFAAFNITATSPGQPIISLANLLYGDVWVCGGQRWECSDHLILKHWLIVQRPNIRTFPQFIASCFIYVRISVLPRMNADRIFFRCLLMQQHAVCAEPGFQRRHSHR
eukprot:SAG11_NODE_869_length_6814_cov_3.266865_1_plen_242_part_00